MIDFRDRESTVPNLVSTLSVLCLIGGFVAWLVLLYGHKTVDPYPEARRNTTKILTEKKKIDNDLALSDAYVTTATWDGDPQNINRDIVNQLNALIKKHNIKLGSIRPQHAAKIDNLDTMPYSVIVEGPYPQILDFARELDRPATKLAVNIVQLTSADVNSDKVTANIGLVAYIKPKLSTSTLKKEVPTTRA